MGRSKGDRLELLRVFNMTWGIIGYHFDNNRITISNIKALLEESLDGIEVIRGYFTINTLYDGK